MSDLFPRPYQPPPEYHDAQRIKSGLRSTFYTGVRMRCFSLSEVATIKRYLTEEEIARCTFTWMEPSQK